MSHSQRTPLTITPFHVAGYVFLLAGLVLAVYHGLEQFKLVPLVSPLNGSWISWSHIHYVTIGGFTQLLFGMLPQLTARKLDRPGPASWYTWLNFVGLNAAFLTLWYGRGWGNVLAFDLGLYAIWLLVLGLIVYLMKQVMQSDGRAWDATMGLYLLSPFIFLVGITYAYGLYAHLWTVPGGWLGLREGHVHANGWGFLGFAVIGTLYDLFPRIMRTDLHSDRLKNYSFWLFALGIGPLVTGPWLGMGRSVTFVGLLLYAGGFVLYLYNMVQTYRSGTSSGIGLSVLVAQFWILAPAGFAPFVLFGIDWVKPAWIEQGALHFFFMGWALPVALAGLMLYFRNLTCIVDDRLGIKERADAAALLPDGVVPDVLPKWLVGVWNVAILLVGFGFFYQDAAWSAYLFGSGYTVLSVIWAYELVVAVRLRRSVRAAAAAEA